MATKSDPIPTHPLLQRLVSERATNVTTLRGYVGPSDVQGRVRLYASLHDLSESIEIDRDDVLHYADTPERIQPFGSLTLWVRRDAQVVYKVDRVEKTATVKEIRAGRLKIVVPGPGTRQEVCQSVCGVCQSVCTVCQSVCSAHLGGKLGGQLGQLNKGRFQ